MAYSSYEDLLSRATKDELIDATWDPDPEELDPVRPIAPDMQVLESAAAESQSLIDAYIRTRYVLPVPVSPMLTGISADITVFRVFNRRKNIDIPQGLTDRYNRAMELLRDISTGKSDLLDKEVVASSPSYGLTRNRMFTNDTMSSYVGPRRS